MTLLSEIYDVTLKRGNRGANAEGYIRPTIGEYTMTHKDFVRYVRLNSPKTINLGEPAKMYEENADIGTDIDGNTVKLHDQGGGTYPTNTPYYVYTIGSNQTNLTYASRINSAQITATTPTNTSIKSAVSFDGRQTWESFRSNDPTLNVDLGSQGTYDSYHKYSQV
jgi:hypothetical protein